MLRKPRLSSSMIRRLLRTLTLVGFSGLPILPAAAQAAGGTNGAKPTLVVFITIDQMRSDYYERFEKQLTGGLKRLYAGGAVFSEGYQDHAITETAPGHASSMSVAFPCTPGS